MTEQRKRGFSSMDKAKQKEIASKGGKAAHIKGTAHEFTSDEARAAGRKGGASSKAKRQKTGAPPEGTTPNGTQAHQTPVNGSHHEVQNANGSQPTPLQEQEPGMPQE